MKRIDVPRLVYAFCYKRSRLKRESWIDKFRIAVSLHVDGRVWSRISEVLTKKYGSAMRHGGWQFVCQLLDEDVTYENIVDLATDWAECGYMVKVAKDEFIQSEMVVRAFKEMRG